MKYAPKIYCLYSDKNETEFLAMARSLKERKKITKEYTEGQWFSYDVDENNGTIFYENTKKKIGCRFPKVAIKTDLKGNVIENKKEKDDERTLKSGEDLRVQ